MKRAARPTDPATRGEGANPPSDPRETARYTLEMLRELRLLLQAQGGEKAAFLSYLVEMAALEAARLNELLAVAQDADDKAAPVRNEARGQEPPHT
jgi:hypothetical protein